MLKLLTKKKKNNEILTMFFVIFNFVYKYFYYVDTLFIFKG